MWARAPVPQWAPTPVNSSQLLWVAYRTKFHISEFRRAKELKWLGITLVFVFAISRDVGMQREDRNSLHFIYEVCCAFDYQKYPPNVLPGYTHNSKYFLNKPPMFAVNTKKALVGSQAVLQATYITVTCKPKLAGMLKQEGWNGEYPDI